MDKKTVLRVFGEAFLRSMVVLMAIVIIGFSAFFIIKVTTDKKQMADNSTTESGSTYSDDELQAMLEKENANDTSQDPVTEEPATEEVTTEEPDIPSTDKKILVLNSTGVSGLAKKWMDKLSGEGFSNVATGNYSLGREAQTKIYVANEQMGKDLAEYFTDAVIEVGSLDSGIDVSTDGVEIFIVLGSNDTTVQ
ncbi:MAG: LytR C-terminal domain-containing protein [Lachnospiraceae bacterium]|nr:LytR C-terminal domain-containing protein [Lachnospiraceae bacterium]